MRCEWGTLGFGSYDTAPRYSAWDLNAGMTRNPAGGNGIVQHAFRFYTFRFQSSHQALSIALPMWLPLILPWIVPPVACDELNTLIAEAEPDTRFSIVIGAAAVPLSRNLNVRLALCACSKLACSPLLVNVESWIVNESVVPSPIRPLSCACTVMPRAGRLSTKVAPLMLPNPNATSNLFADPHVRIEYATSGGDITARNVYLMNLPAGVAAQMTSDMNAGTSPMLFLPLFDTWHKILTLTPVVPGPGVPAYPGLDGNGDYRVTFDGAAAPQREQLFDRVLVPALVLVRRGRKAGAPVR